MPARIESLSPSSSQDRTINAILDLSENGLGDTQMFGLLTRRPELSKRIATAFAYFLLIILRRVFIHSIIASRLGLGTLVGVAAASLAAPALIAQGSFEGIVTVNIAQQMAGQAHGPHLPFIHHAPESRTVTYPVTYTLKGSKVRWDDASQSQITDPESGTVTMIDNKRKTYTTAPTFGMASAAQPQMVQQPVDTAAMQQHMDGTRSAPGIPKFVTKLGTSETIAGVPCDDYSIGHIDQLCVAGGMGNFLPGMVGMMASGPANPFGAAFPNGIFVLKDSTSKTVITVTKIERQPVDPSEFEVPAGYKRQ